jgi:hypothetical protein
MFLHVFYSWLLTQIIHPFLLVLFFYIKVGPDQSILTFNPAIIILLTIVSSIASLPCLFFGWLFLGVIVHSSYTLTLKFLLWLLATAGLVISNFWIFMLYLNGKNMFVMDEQLIESLLMSIPGILSIWLVSVTRVQQFRNLIYNQQNNNQVTDLV